MAKSKRHDRPQPVTPAPSDFDATRFTNNYMGYWQICGNACRRKRGCAGDAQACFDRLWPLTPERFRVNFRAVIRARMGGASVAEALEAGKAEVVRQADLIAEIDARQIAECEERDEARRRKQEAAHPASGREDKKERTPRVRTL